MFDFGSVESEEECKDSTFVPTPLQSHLRYEFVETPIDIEDDMPHKYQFIRDGARLVRKEYYTLICKMISELHMSQAQAEGAVVNTANELFGRKWKV